MSNFEPFKCRFSHLIAQNATLSCTPYLINAIVNPFLGRILDWGRANRYWTQTRARKIAVFISKLRCAIYN